jgi:poly(ADP-ribose) glycohydrolase
LFEKIAELATELPTVCTEPIPLLRAQHDSSVSMTQKQAACLLANAFFCTFPQPATLKLLDFSFMGLHWQPSCGKEELRLGKFDCIFNYFRRVLEHMPCGTITFHRQVIDVKKLPAWSKCETKILAKLRVSADGRMLTDASRMLCVDFANKFIGGGVLGNGCDQEDITFLHCPELIVSRLFTEEFDDNEALIVKGFERFNNCIGYMESFCWAGNHVDTSPCDRWGRRISELVAIDSLVLQGYTVHQQLSKIYLKRELNKAYCGFCGPASPGKLCTVATGSWGCGARGGDPIVKALIQLMAASVAQRPVFYFTFDDQILAADINEIHQTLIKEGFTVGQLWHCISGLADDVGNSLTSTQLYDFITNHSHPRRSHSSSSKADVIN